MSSLLKLCSLVQKRPLANHLDQNIDRDSDTGIEGVKEFHRLILIKPMIVYVTFEKLVSVNQSFKLNLAAYRLEYS